MGCDIPEVSSLEVRSQDRQDGFGLGEGNYTAQSASFNIGLQPTTYSVRSYVAPAFGSG